MAWRFRKRIKIIPGVHITLNSKGISTTIGVKGASMTFGKSGTYLNTSIPQLGISNRQKISGSLPSHVLPTLPQPSLPDMALSNEDNIYSASIHEITSQNMQGIKESIILAQEQREELKSELLKIQSSLTLSIIKKVGSYVFLYGLFYKKIPNGLSLDIAAQKDAIEKTKKFIEDCYVKLDIDFDPDILKKYNTLIESFEKLSQSRKIWDITSANFQDRVVTRSSATTVVNKRDVKFMFKQIADIKSDYNVPFFQNANGADLYFYPSFILMYANNKSFAIIGYDEVEFSSSSVRFVETGYVPADSKVIDRTWAKVNKNGSPDKRFKGNYQIPIAQYGNIQLRTRTGLNEEYQISNNESTMAFASAFKNYQNSLRQIN